MRSRVRVRFGVLPALLMGAVCGPLPRSHAQAQVSTATASPADELERGRSALVAGEPGEALLWLQQASVKGSQDPLLPQLTAWAMRAASGMRAVLQGHSDAVLYADFRADGQRVVTASADKTARIWDVRSGRSLLVLAPHPAAVERASFAADGRSITTICSDKSVFRWDATTGALLERRPPVKTIGPASSAVYETWQSDGVHGVTLKNPPAETHPDSLGGHTAPVRHVSFSSDPQLMLTTSADHSARLWDRDSEGQCSDRRERAVLAGHTGPVLYGRFSRDNKWVVTTSADHTARLWSTAVTRHLQRLCLIHHIDSARWAGGGREIDVTAGGIWGVRWNAVSGEKLWHNSVERGLWIHPALGPDGEVVIGPQGVSDRDDDPDFVEIRAMRPGGGSVRLPVRTTWDVTGAVWSRDGQRVFLLGEPAIYQAGSGRRLVSLDGEQVTSASFNHDGTLLLTLGAAEGSGKLWEVATGMKRAVLSPNSPVLSQGFFSPRADQLVVLGKDAAAFLHDGRTGKRLATLGGHTAPIVHAAFSPDGSQLATASQDSTARIFAAATGQSLIELKGHGGGVTHVSWRSDGRYLLTAGADATSRLWDATTGRLLLVLHGHAAPLMQAHYSPNDYLISTLSKDRSVLVYDLSTPSLDKAVLANFTRCRMPLRLQGGRLAPAPIDLRACAALPPELR